MTYLERSIDENSGFILSVRLKLGNRDDVRLLL